MITIHITADDIAAAARMFAAEQDYITTIVYKASKMYGSDLDKVYRGVYTCVKHRFERAGHDKEMSRKAALLMAHRAKRSLQLPEYAR